MNIVDVGYDSTNYYVLGASSNRLLVDVGWPGTLPRLLAILKRKDIAMEEIGYLLITHYHPDHAGLAQEVKAICTGDVIALAQGTEKLVALMQATLMAVAAQTGIRD